jgi:hypothetical protein
MIDMDMYHRMNPDESESQPKEGDLTPQIMESDEAPEGSFVFLLPAIIVGYCLQDKKWSEFHPEIPYVNNDIDTSIRRPTHRAYA